MQAFLKALWTDEAGQDATEYILLIVFIALLVAAGMVAFAGGLNNVFDTVAGTIQGAADGSSLPAASS